MLSPYEISALAATVGSGLVAGLSMGLALTPSDLTIFQYVEPFGTAFYLSSPLLLWVILAGILVAIFIFIEYNEP